jgi:hypothetical protein
LDPEIGVEYYRLGRTGIERTTGAFQKEPEICSVVPFAIPECMHTDPACIDSLITWFRTSSSFSELQQHYVPSFSPLPCQYRSLAQLQACTGVVSHVIATVNDLHLHQQPASTVVVYHKKRKFGSKAPSAQVVLPPVFATLTNGTTTVMTFLVDSNHPKRQQHFHCTLQQAFHEKKPLRFSRIVSKSVVRRAAGEVVIAPTAETTISIATEQEIVDYNTTKSQQPFVMSMTQHIGPETGPLLSLTQHCNHTNDNNSRDRKEEESITLSAYLVDICLNGVSLRQEQQKKTHDWNRLFQSNADRSAYCDTVLLILGFPDAFNDNTKAESTTASMTATATRKVRANGKILQLLCGGLELSEWQQEETNVDTESNRQSPYGTLVCDLIRGLLDGKIPLQWTIQKQTQQHHQLITTNGNEHEIVEHITDVLLHQL